VIEGGLRRHRTVVCRRRDPVVGKKHRLSDERFSWFAAGVKGSIEPRKGEEKRDEKDTPKSVASVCGAFSVHGATTFLCEWKISFGSVSRIGKGGYPLSNTAVEDDRPPVPPCIHTRFASSQTIEAHFREVASIRGEPEAVELGRGVRKTRFNQGFSAPSPSVPRSEDVNEN
jgi:hypothetical protein